MPGLCFNLSILFLEYIIDNKFSITYNTNVSTLFTFTIRKLLGFESTLGTECQPTELAIFGILYALVLLFAAVAFR